MTAILLSAEEPFCGDGRMPPRRGGLLYYISISKGGSFFKKLPPFAVLPPHLNLRRENLLHERRICCHAKEVKREKSLIAAFVLTKPLGITEERLTRTGGEKLRWSDFSVRLRQY